MAAKYQEHLQKELQEKQQQQEAAARRQAVRELAAQQREVRCSECCYVMAVGLLVVGSMCWPEVVLACQRCWCK